MIRKFPHLCSPITLGRTTFRNRMFSAPMGGTDIANDGCIGPKSTAFYELRAKGGAEFGNKQLVKRLGKIGTRRIGEARTMSMLGVGIKRELGYKKKLAIDICE